MFEFSRHFILEFILEKDSNLLDVLTKRKSVHQMVEWSNFQLNQWQSGRRMFRNLRANSTQLAQSQGGLIPPLFRPRFSSQEGRRSDRIQSWRRLIRYYRSQMPKRLTDDRRTDDFILNCERKKFKNHF
ncbi:hypothetical protein PRIPAC_97861, partial [Pristionchus pacificus]|uniref:Uncharacterized protein n=1 Tax=Pristionchus pacificus TaxID=54126 RepID=A0A2A6BJT4_PRIPA